VNPWKFGVLTSLCLSLFVIFACSEERAYIIGPAPQNTKAEVQRETMTIVEEQPSYNGGMKAFSQYVMRETKYPLQASKSGVEGTVQVQFVIERNASISNVSAISGIGSGCDEEAIRVIKNAADFTPGSQRGRTVSSTMVMPVTFKLNPDEKNADKSIKGTIIAGKIVAKNAELIVRANYNNGEWSGTVTSPEGDALAGTNIVVAGTNYGTVTDRDGTFSIKVEKDQ
jgi:TonB family protein